MTMTMATNVQAQGVQDKVAGKENLPLAEKQRFELWRPVKAYTISNRAPSTN